MNKLIYLIIFFTIIISIFFIPILSTINIENLEIYEESQIIFLGNKNSFCTILKAKPDVFNHNMETVPRLYKIARPKADYLRSLNLLSYIKENDPEIITKTGIMVGLGETKDEIIQTMKDILNSKVDILTIGQYIRPSKLHLKVDRYYKEEEFEELKNIALELGFGGVVSAPLARSSYMAAETYNLVKNKN